MADIEPLTQHDPAVLYHLLTGYTSEAKYRFSRTKLDERFASELEQVLSSQPIASVMAKPYEEENRAIRLGRPGKYVAGLGLAF